MDGPIVYHLGPMATTNTNTGNWLGVDIKGWAQVLRNKGVPRIGLEPISNAFDTEATEITVTFSQEKGWAVLVVTDDDPDGFADLRDAYMLFAPSQRRNDPTKRGRFGQGEKELIAICATGGDITIASTTGTVKFSQEQGRLVQNQRRRETGSELTANFRCNQGEAVEFGELVRSLIVPAGVKLTFNGEIVQRPEPVKVVSEVLATKIVDDEGNLADSRRRTDIELYEPAQDEVAYIYELGVPVVEHDGRWHVNVMQKVPLNTARDNVTPAYLRRLREIMLNETHDLLTSVDMKTAWVRDALPNATDAAVTSYVHEKYGKDAVIYDLSSPEATKRAIDQGRFVIQGRAESAGIWSRIKEVGVVKPAGQVIQVGIPTSIDGIPPIPRDEWTPDMENIERYVHEMGDHLLGFQPRVEFSMASTGKKRSSASWGGGTVTFYLRNVGRSWPGSVSEVDLDALVIHEFTHNWEDDHYTDRFIHVLADLGAKLRSFKGSLR